MKVALLAGMLVTSPVAEFPALDQVKLNYQTCAELAVADEFVRHVESSFEPSAAAERALGACRTEEDAFYSLLAAILAAHDNRTDVAVLRARAAVSQFKVRLKATLINDLREMAAVPRRK